MLGVNGTGANAVTVQPAGRQRAAAAAAAGGEPARAAERDRRAPPPGSLLVLSPGIYNENVLCGSR